MSRRYKLIFVAIAVAFLSIVGGIVFVYFGNYDVDAVPQSLLVQKVDGEYYLVAQYNANYEYRFTIEQRLDGQFCTLSTIDSTNNKILLKDQNLNTNPGNVFRFTACYLTENKVEGKKSQSVEWVVPEEEFVVDYSQVTLTGTELAWERVDNATYYVVKLVDGNLEETILVTETTSIDLSEVYAGNYRIYIAPIEDLLNEENEQYGEGKQFTLKKTAHILSASLGEQNLVVVVDEHIERFEVYNGNELLLTLVPSLTQEVGTGIRYTINDCAFLFTDIDFATADVKIKALSTAFVYESAFVSVEQ